MLTNSHRTGFLGLFVGGSTLIFAAVGALFRLLSRPQYLVDLYHAIRAEQYHTASAADALAVAQLGGACIALIGALVLALLLTYFGRPYTVAPDSGVTTPVKPTPPG